MALVMVSTRSTSTLIVAHLASVPIRYLAGNWFFTNRNLLQRRVEQETQLGKTDVLFN